MFLEKVWERVGIPRSARNVIFKAGISDPSDKLQQDAIHFLRQLVLALVAHDLLLDLAVLDEEQGGNAANAVALRRSCIAVHIHLHDLELAVVLIRDLVHQWGNGLTGAAPSRPEGTQDRLW